MDTIVDSEHIDLNRRRLFGAAAATVTAAQLGLLIPAKAQQVPAGTKLPEIKPVTNVSFAPLKHINAGVLNVAYAEAGPAGGPVVILLHGWPYDIHSFVDVAPMLASAGYRVLVPYLRGYGATRFLSSEAFRNGQPSALAVDVIDFMDALKIEKAVLAGFDWGARSADIVAALWPERVKALVAVSGYLIGSQEAGKMPLPPRAELEWWYQFYFATERGRLGYEKNRNDFNKLIWQIASPKWQFDDATFARSAAAFDNPDHVDIVIHNYRWRLGLADGEPKYASLEKRLAEFPAIAVPAITLESDGNGAPHPDPSAYAKKFTGRYQHRHIEGGIGHNLPQEDPKAFVDAIIDVVRARRRNTKRDSSKRTAMSKTSRAVHTARTRTTGGREHGVSRSSDGRLDVRLAAPDSSRIGTNPEHLFAAAWSACFESAIGLAAPQRKIKLPAGVAIDAEMDLNLADGAYFLSARLNVSLPGVERDTARALIDEAHKTCPYSKATRGNMNVTIKLVE